MADDVNVTINNLYLYVPSLIPNAETQVMFIEAYQNNYKISLMNGIKKDEYYQIRLLNWILVLLNTSIVLNI